MQKMKQAFVVSASFLFVLLAAAIAAPAQTFRSLLSFDSTDGGEPLGTVVQGTDGNLYGTTEVGGTYGGGTIFKITQPSTPTTLYSFCTQTDCADGAAPSGGLAQSTDGTFYGTSQEGGANGGGTVFELSPSGTFTTLYSFCSQIDCVDGLEPWSTLVQGPDGNLYGTTAFGGANDACFGGCGTVFKITPSGTLTTLHSFCAQSGCADGTAPIAGLVLGTDGNFYGTTPNGGTGNACNAGCGTVFRITPGGTLTTLYSFNLADGAIPVGGVIQAIDRNFYGTTYDGGAYDYGTVFKMTSSDTLTTIYSFCSTMNDCPDGWGPYVSLVQATDGEFYGTTLYGGHQGNDGTVFKVTSSGTLETIHAFSGRDGANPQEALVQVTNGSLYGATSQGGTSDDGTLFRLSVGLEPFVKTQPTSGALGRLVKILGTDLTGATSVTFNGTAATFTVASPSLITTTVPAGATTGTVQVVTPGGTLSSNVPFRVIP